MTSRYLFLLLVAIAFGVARFIVPVEGRIDHADIFKDLAHVFVGGCFGAAIQATASNSNKKLGQAIFDAAYLWAIAIGLTILEVVAFLARRQ